MENSFISKIFFEIILPQAIFFLKEYLFRLKLIIKKNFLMIHIVPFLFQPFPYLCTPKKVLYRNH